jgi:cob(I)alamin adenosyltransferase
MSRVGIGIRTATQRQERATGQIHLYDGKGKGKSQAALGVVLRSLGLGIEETTPVLSRGRILLLQFLKGADRQYDEDAAIDALRQAFPHLIDRVRTGRTEYFGPDEITAFDRAEALRGWDVARGAFASDLYSVVVLDELSPILDLGLLSVAEVVSALKQKSRYLEVIITGRDAPQELVELADLHSEIVPRGDKTQPLRLLVQLPDRTESSAGDNTRPPKLEEAGIEIYTGAGKGKSTSALGKALQAIGRGIGQDRSHRVLIVQWLKGGSGYTEDAAIDALKQSYPQLVDRYRCGRDAIVWRGQQETIDYQEATRGWEIASQAIASGLYKTVILDELNPTVDLDLLPQEPIVETLKNKPPSTEVIITGRCLNQPAYFDLATVHSEMVCHKHYAERGVDLRRGIDF